VKYTYYPGCSLEASARAYDESLRYVFSSLGQELIELEDWNCCGATSYFSVKETISLVVSARNLALAERLGHDIVAPCSSCYTILYKTNAVMKKNFIMKEKVNQALRKDDLEYNLSLDVRHPLEVLLNDIGTDIIAKNIHIRLSGLRMAHYYGCQIVRPDRGLDDKEDPEMMDHLFQALGAENVLFPSKVKCCGGMLMTTYPEVALKLNKDILECATESKADVIVTTCPLCQVNLEAYQKRINKHFGTRLRIPILYFTQALGLALGGSPRQLGLGRNLVPFKLDKIAREVHA
jgi:heterodisulfide reductase subunit B